MKNKCYIGLKTLWGKEQLLVTWNLSFCHNILHSYIALVHQNVVLCGNGLTLYQNVGLNQIESIKILQMTTQFQLLTPVGKRPFENNVGKGENAGNQPFLLSHNVFCFIKDINHHFTSHVSFVDCNCFQFGQVKNFVVWQRVKIIISPIDT